MSNLAQILRLSSRFGCSFLQVTGDLTPSPNPMGIWRLELQRLIWLLLSPDCRRSYFDSDSDGSSEARTPKVSN
ncbi:hypothetical protein SLE2022_216000 [Rubroshorea leprosula]